LFIPEIEQNRRICFRAKQKRLRIELPDRGICARPAATNKPDPSFLINQLGRVTTYSTAPAIPAPPLLPPLQAT